MESPHSPKILSSAATGICDFIEVKGGHVGGVFEVIHVPPTLIGAPDHKVDLGTFCQLFEVAAKATACENFGLLFGEQFGPRDIGALGYAVVSSPTLEAALENLGRLARYHQEASLLRLQRLPGNMAQFEYQILKSEIVERRQDSEFSLVTFQNIIRECCGSRWVPHEVHFEHPKPHNTQHHARIFGAPVYFSQPRNAILFDARTLDTAMPASDCRLLEIMETALRRINEQAFEISAIDLLKTHVRRRLPDGYPSLEKIAVEMKLSPAFLKREMLAEGVSYDKLVDEIRQNLALSYVQSTSLSLSEISLLLGYSELSAFSRAFRRWSGRSARAFRIQ